MIATGVTQNINLIYIVDNIFAYVLILTEYKCKELLDYLLDSLGRKQQQRYNWIVPWQTIACIGTQHFNIEHQETMNKQRNEHALLWAWSWTKDLKWFARASRPLCYISLPEFWDAIISDPLFRGSRRKDRKRTLGFFIRLYLLNCGDGYFPSIIRGCTHSPV